MIEKEITNGNKRKDKYTNQNERMRTKKIEEKTQSKQHRKNKELETRKHERDIYKQ